MSAGFLYSANTSPQTVAIGGVINMGNIIRRFGCVKGTSLPFATVNGGTTILSSCGKCPKYFKFDTDFVVVTTAAGTVTITAFQDGVAIPGATASATVAADATSVTLPLSFGVRLNSCVTSSTITYVLTGADSTVNNVAQTVELE